MAKVWHYYSLRGAPALHFTINPHRAAEASFNEIVDWALQIRIDSSTARLPEGNAIRFNNGKHGFPRPGRRKPGHLGPERQVVGRQDGRGQRLASLADRAGRRETVGYPAGRARARACMREWPVRPPACI